MNGRDGAWGVSRRDIEAAGRESAGHLLTSLRARGREVAGRYRIEDLLGAGSSGIVLSARHVYLGEMVALKILRCTTVAGARAQRRKLPERHVAASLASRHVARTLDAGFTMEGAPFLVSERLIGETVADVIARRGAIPCAEAVGWVLQACEALAEAHARDLVHADLKPRNLFLEGQNLKVLDFGMVTPLEEAADDHGTTWFSSPAYFSPEQIENPGAVDARTDIWALGVILYELLTGTPPFHSDSVAGTLVAVTMQDPPPLPDHVPPPLASLIRTCLEKDPRSRPSNVRNLAMALMPYAGSTGPALVLEVESAGLRGLSAGAPAPLPFAVPPPPPLPERRQQQAASTPTTSRRAVTLPSRRVREAARRRSRRVFLLAAAVLLAAAATLAMPSNQLTRRAIRDLARPPVLETARTILDPPDPPDAPLPGAIAALTSGPLPPKPEPPRPERRSEAALPPAPVPPKARTRHATGFTHPSQLH